jgi:S-adenosylmethionine:tRNA ribosyltransferase-isomerase
MRTDDFDYFLPEELIAQTPLKDRSSSKLLVLHKKTGEIEHKTFKDIIEYLNPGDALVINDSKVIPARLIGIKESTGAVIELLLLKNIENDNWECLAKPAKRIKIGTTISFGDGLLNATCIGIGEEGIRIMRFKYEGIYYDIYVAKNYWSDSYCIEE